MALECGELGWSTILFSFAYILKIFKISWHILGMTPCEILLHFYIGINIGRLGWFTKVNFISKIDR